MSRFSILKSFSSLGEKGEGEERREWGVTGEGRKGIVGLKGGAGGGVGVGVDVGGLLGCLCDLFVLLPKEVMEREGGYLVFFFLLNFFFFLFFLFVSSPLSSFLLFSF